MTTIAYSHKDKEIAIDSRQTMGSCITNDNATKRITNSYGEFYFAGDVCDCELLADNIHEEKTPESCNAYGIAVIDGIVYWVSTPDNYIKLYRIDFDMTAGSGEAYAQAALDFGMTAEEAVKYAMTRDTYTGGEVWVYPVVSDSTNPLTK